MKNAITAIVCMFLFVGACVAGYTADSWNPWAKEALASMPYANDIARATAMGELSQEELYLLNQPPVDPDAYIYVGPGVVKAK